MGVPTELSLFTGAGGGLLGTKYLLGWRTVCYVEWDKYAIDVLRARIRDGWLDDAPIWDDAFTFDGRPWRGLVDVVSAGFPCQPFSVAGKGLAEIDPRNGWPATIRIIREVRPRVAWLENVPGLLSKPYFGTILGELAEAGYDARWECVAAEEIGANHKRERLWIMAYSDGFGSGTFGKNSDKKGSTKISFSGSEVADADCIRCEGQSWEQAWQWKAKDEFGERSKDVSNSTGIKLGKSRTPFAAANLSGQRDNLSGRKAQDDRGTWWAVEPELGRVADGVAHRVDRLRAIGNGQVSGVVAEAWRRLCQQ